MNLITLAQKGDSQAWADLYRHVTPKLLTYCRAKKPLDTSLTEEDIISETWVTIAEKIHEFTGDEKGFTAWAFTIANNILLNSNRKTIRRKTDATEDFTLINTEAFQEDWLAAEEILKLLPEKEREIVLLIDLLGFTSKDAGEVLGLSSVNVRVLRSRALKKLRKQMS